MMIRPIASKDTAAICGIYNYYILNTTVSFEERAVTNEEMTERIGKIVPQFPWLVYEEEGAILGYAYATAWKPRGAYKFAVESSVYLKDGVGGRGIGSALYSELLSLLKAKNYHAIIGGIALPNAGSIALHKKFGFEKVAHFKDVGFKFGEWVDVTYWELLV